MLSPGNCTAKLTVKLHVPNNHGHALWFSLLWTCQFSRHMVNFQLGFDNHWNLIIHHIIYGTCKSHWNIDSDINKGANKTMNNLNENVAWVCCWRTIFDAVSRIYRNLRKYGHSQCTPALSTYRKNQPKKNKINRSCVVACEVGCRRRKLASWMKYEISCKAMQ